MQILLIYPEGRRREGLLLSATPDRIRVMLPGNADSVEYRFLDGEWLAESGASVQIAAIAAVPRTFLAWREPVAHAAVRLSVC